MISVYEQRGFEKGIAEGVARGRRAWRIREMQQKFRQLPGEIIAQFEATTDSVELDRLADAILTAAALEEI